MDTAPDARSDRRAELTAAQRIAIALGTAERPPPPGTDPASDPEPVTAAADETGSPV